MSLPLVRHALIVTAVLTAAVAACRSTRTGVINPLPSPIVATKKSAPPIVASYVPPPRPTPITRPTYIAPPPPPTPAPVDAGAGWIPARGISNRWEKIVIHHSDSTTGNATIFDNYHRNEKGWDELGYHFVIGNGTNSGDGEVEVGPRWDKQKTGAHCKTPDNYYNLHGVGICLVGDFEVQHPTPAQLAALRNLVHFLQGQTGMDSTDLVTHGQVKSTICPGKNFSLSMIY